MKNKQNKKLKKLDIVDEEEKAYRALTKHFVKQSDLIKGAAITAGIGAGVAAVGAATSGVIGALNGGDVQQSALAGGLVAAGLAAGINVNVQGEMVYRVSKGKVIAEDHDARLWKCVAGATLLCGGLGAGIDAGAHKLTTSIINHLQPKHQIEQTVEVEPMPVIDEIQVEK